MIGRDEEQADESMSGDATGLEPTRRRLDPGEVLYQLGTFATSFAVVVSGNLEVLAAADTSFVIADLGVGDLTGEIAALAGGRRSATVRARGETVIDEYPINSFTAWLNANPNRTETIHEQTRSRLDRTRLIGALTRLIGPEHDYVVAEIARRVDWVHLDPGQALFDQGDPSDAAYVLVSGRIRVQGQSDPSGPGAAIDAYLLPGEILGEMGLIESAPRNATARATRAATLARFSKAVFFDLTSKYPAIMVALARTVITRVARAPATRPGVATVAVVTTAADAPGDLITDLGAEVSRFGPTVHLDRAAADARMGVRGASDAPSHTLMGSRLGDLLHEIDVANRFTILEGEPNLGEWTRRVVADADRVVVICSTRPDPAELEVIQAVFDLVGADRAGWLARLIPPGTNPPTGTAELRATVGADRAVVLRAGNPGSRRRLARLMVGQGVGVALSGGGARAFAHIGALAVLAEHGVEIDAVAGTSMGSVVGAFAALSDDIDRLAAAATRSFADRLIDYTVPITSLISARRITDGIQANFGRFDIEDTVIPFVTNSTNLSTAQPMHHRTGSLAHAVRASVSLPGVFPPVVSGDSLLVDGGVLENLPVGPLVEDPAVSTIIAIDVSPPKGPTARVDYGASLSGFEVLKSRLTRPEDRYPKLAHTVVQSMLVGSARARADAVRRGKIDLLVQLDLRGFKLLDFSVLEAAVARGRAEAHDAVAAWAESRRAGFVGH